MFHLATKDSPLVMYADDLLLFRPISKRFLTFQFNLMWTLFLDRIVWDPQHKKDQLLVEKVQLFAARLAIKSWTQDQTSLFTSLNLPSLIIMNHSSYIPQTYFVLKLYYHVFCPSVLFTYHPQPNLRQDSTVTVEIPTVKVESWIKFGLNKI